MSGGKHGERKAVPRRHVWVNGERCTLTEAIHECGATKPGWRASFEAALLTDGIYVNHWGKRFALSLAEPEKRKGDPYAATRLHRPGEPLLKAPCVHRISSGY